MKHKYAAWLSLLAGAVAGTSALADTITFGGSLDEQTCRYDTPGGYTDTDLELNLGPVSMAEFESVPKPGNQGLQSTRAPVPFTIRLFGCPAHIRPYARFHSPMSGRALNPWFGALLVNTIPESAGGAVGLYVEILVDDAAKTVAEVLPTYAANPMRHTNDPIITTDAAGNATLTYWARYAREYYGVVKPGTYSSYTYYTVNYD